MTRAHLEHIIRAAGAIAYLEDVVVIGKPGGSQGVFHCLPWDADTELKWADLLAQLRTTGKSHADQGQPHRGDGGCHWYGGRHAKPLIS